MLRRHSSFSRLVAGLKEKGKTCTVVESCCGGLINASIMQVPGSSAVYFGGSIAYNTKRAKKLLLNDDELHSKLIIKKDNNNSDTADAYIQSKQDWTRETAIAFCEQMNVDYAIAEGGASGPTFRPKGLTTGFAVIAVAGRDKDTGRGKLLAQTTVRSTHADRVGNMELFADAAAELAAEVIGINNNDDSKKEDEEEIKKTTKNNSSNNINDDDNGDGVWLDRASHIRVQEDQLKALEENLNPNYVVLRDTKDCLFASDSKLHLVERDNIPPDLPRTFLGLDVEEGRPLFSVDLPSAKNENFQLPPDAFFDNIRTHAPLLTPKDNELVLYATAMAQWRRTHKFCSTCGQPLEPIHGGTCLKCSNPTDSCNALWWPRQDPSIIVLVTSRDKSKALLARSARHPPTMHTCLAGFVEAGETFEKAVMRETLEETGARVDSNSIDYLSSQPWPFPRSCMIGFQATADEDAPLEIDPNEIVSAEWFDKDRVARAAEVPGAVMNHDVAREAMEKDPSIDLLIPPKGVLARTLIDNWLEDSSV